MYWTLFSGDGSGTLEPHQVEYANTPLTAGSTYTDVSGTNANMLRCTNAMAVDGSGHIWILAAQSSCSRPYTSVLDEFAPPITPQSTPIATYTLSPSGLADAMAFDSSGDLFVGDVYNNQVFEYAGPLIGGGTLSPSLTLSSGLNQPNGVAVDTHGNLFVSNGKSTGTSSIAVFHTPVSTMTTPTFLSGLTNPGGLILDSAGNLYGSSTPSGSGAIVRYNGAAGAANGAGPDIVNATGSMAADYEASFAFDIVGNLYDADCGSNPRIMVFPTGSMPFASTLAPSATYTNSSITSIGCTWGIAIH